MFNKLVKLVTLKPYGSALTDGVVDIWLLFAMLSVAAVSTCDAIAWGYLGYTMASGWAAYGAAVFAGGIALTLVGSLDATFVMHDTSRADEVVPMQETSGAIAWLKTHLRAGHLAVVARIVLVVLSFTVTAPFLTQLFFARDIAAAIARNNEMHIASKRSEVAAKYNNQIIDLSTRLAARNKNLEAEVAGTGGSGRFGDGPAAAAIRGEIAALRNEIDNTEAARTAELQLFDTARSADLANRWGVDIEREGPDTRARVVGEMEKSTTFRATRRTVKAFLVFLFLAMVSLKLFEPSSVRVYFNAELQAAYKRLIAGLFDTQLDEREHAGAGMAPLHFARWYEKRQHVREVTEELRDRAAELRERQRIREQAISDMQKTLTDDIVKINEDLNAATGEADGLEQKLLAARAEMTTLSATVEEQQQELSDFGQMRDELPLRDRQFLIDGRMKAAKELASNRVKLNDVVATVTRLTAQVQTSRSNCRIVTLSLEEASRELVDLNKLIAEARRQNMRDLT